jgi:hypothetical protein
MKTPEQPYFVAPVMIEKMPELPNYVTIDKPIPGKTGLKGSQMLEKPNTQGNHSNGNKSAHKPIKDVNKEVDFIYLGLRIFIDKP